MPSANRKRYIKRVLSKKLEQLAQEESDAQEEKVKIALRELSEKEKKALEEEKIIVKDVEYPEYSKEELDQQEDEIFDSRPPPKKVGRKPWKVKQ